MRLRSLNIYNAQPYNVNKIFSFIIQKRANLVQKKIITLYKILLDTSDPQPDFSISPISVGFS